MTTHFDLKLSWRRVLSSLFILIIFFGVLVTLFLEPLQENFHVVIPGQVYRSAQLDWSELSGVIKKYKIKSIINLRGYNPDKNWYRQELSVSYGKSVAHYDLALSSYKLPTGAQLRKLKRLIETAPRPLLIHCAGGADRSGLAAAMALILHGESLAQAMRQISLFYLVVHRDSVGRLVFPYYENWLKQHDLTHSKENFLLWLKQVNFKKKQTQLQP